MKWISECLLFTFISVISVNYRPMCILLNVLSSNCVVFLLGAPVRAITEPGMFCSFECRPSLRVLMLHCYVRIKWWWWWWWCWWWWSTDKCTLQRLRSHAAKLQHAIDILWLITQRVMFFTPWRLISRVRVIGIVTVACTGISIPPTVVADQALITICIGLWHLSTCF